MPRAEHGFYYWTRSFGANVAQPPPFFIFDPQESNPAVGAQISAPDRSITFLFVIGHAICVIWSYGRYSAVVRGRPVGYFHRIITGSTRNRMSWVCLESCPSSYCKLLQAGPAWLMHDHRNRDNCSQLSTMQLYSIWCNARPACIYLIQYSQFQPGPDGIHHSRTCLVNAYGFLACGMVAYAAMGSAPCGDETCWRHLDRQYRPQYSSLDFRNRLPGQSVE